MDHWYDDNTYNEISRASVVAVSCKGVAFNKVIVMAVCLIKRNWLWHKPVGLEHNHVAIAIAIY